MGFVRRGRVISGESFEKCVANLEGPKMRNVRMRSMDSNYYLGVTFSAAGGGTTRVHASWFSVDLGTLDGAEDLVFGSTIDNIRKDAERIDNWISENGVPGRSD